MLKKNIRIIKIKLDEYTRRSYVLNLNYFSVKSVKMLFLNYHRIRFIYRLMCFTDSYNWKEGRAICQSESKTKQ